MKLRRLRWMGHTTHGRIEKHGSLVGSGMGRYGTGFIWLRIGTNSVLL